MTVARLHLARRRTLDDRPEGGSTAPRAIDCRYAKSQSARTAKKYFFAIYLVANRATR
jgi:hypothetical protein